MIRLPSLQSGKTVSCFLLLLLFAISSGCTNKPRPYSQALPALESSPLTTTILEQGALHQGLSGFRLLNSSADSFTARVELIQAAKYSLDLQYYIVHDGLSTRILLYELLAAADRGVRIRLLIDDTASDSLDDDTAQITAHPNIEVRVFNPLYVGRTTGFTRNLGRLLHLSQQHRRMHNKLWLADSSAAILGGRNLGDEYFNAGATFSFTDIDLLCVGPVAEDLSNSFDEYWNHSLSQPLQDFLWRSPTEKKLKRVRKKITRELDRKALQQDEPYTHLFDYRQTPQLQKWLKNLVWANASALWDVPDKVLISATPEHLQLPNRLLPQITDAKHELILISAYFVPTRPGVERLTATADKGVSILLHTNALEATDVPIVHGGYGPYRRELLEHGIRIYEFRRYPSDYRRANLISGSAASLHSKAVIIDQEKVFIGSLNLDPRSILWNTEVGVLVYSRELAMQTRELAIQAQHPSISYEVRLSESGSRRGSGLIWIAENDGKTEILRREPGNLWRRLNAWVARTVGLEQML